MTALIREKYLRQNGALFIELGEYLIKARALCEEAGLRFEDYIDRVLCLPRLAARMAVKSFSYKLSPELGAENMRFVSSISNSADRENAARALLAGKSPDTVKMALRAGRGEEDGRSQLEKERSRLLRTIDVLSQKLKTVEEKLQAAH